MPAKSSVKNKFIPKQSLNGPATNKSGAFQDVVMLVTLVTLASSLAVAAGMYIYSVHNQKLLDQAKKSLQFYSEKFQALTVNDFQTLGKQLEAGDRILRNHLAVSAIFDALESSTLKSVQYTKFSYSAKSPEEIDVQLEGRALSVNALAWQSKILGAQKRIFKNPVFSNLDLKGGQATFSVNMQVNPDAVRFENIVASRLQQTNSNTADTIVEQQNQSGSGLQTNLNTTGGDIFDAASSTKKDNALNNLNATSSGSEFGI